MASSLVTPLLISQPFGFAAANPTYINLPIPVPSQIMTTVNAASFTDGFPPSTMTPEASGGLPFFGQDMNGILWMLSAYCANFAAGAFSTYNATLAGDVSGYPAGAVLVNAAGNGLWINQISGNASNPDTGGANWLAAALVGKSAVTVTGGAVTLSAAQASSPFIVFSGTLTSNSTITLPTAPGQQWVVANSTTGAFTVTCKTAAGTGIVIAQTGAAAPTSIYCDGANIQNTGVSTAGLAPINSPTFTGVPAAPTASSSTNTTQLATTAMVQAAITAALAAYAPKASPIFTGTPAAPTAAPGTNTAQLATTAFVQAAVNAQPVVRSGTFTCVAGVASVSFGFTFASVPRVFVQWNYANPDAGWVVPGSITTTGFQYQNSNSGTCDWLAITAP